MSAKKISIGVKPSTTRTPVAADAWVEHRNTDDEVEPMKRLTIDVPCQFASRNKVTMRLTW